MKTIVLFLLLFFLSIPTFVSAKCCSVTSLVWGDTSALKLDVSTKSGKKLVLRQDKCIRLNPSDFPIVLKAYDSTAKKWHTHTCKKAHNYAIEGDLTAGFGCSRTVYNYLGCK